MIEQKTVGYQNFWKIEKPEVKQEPEFTEFQIAVMEGGHCLEEPKVSKFTFLRTLKNTLP